MNNILLGATAAVATISGSALLAQAAPPAQPAPRAHRMMQTELRTDVQGHVAKMFARLDANHDGFIDKSEMDAREAKREAKVEQRAAKFDPAQMFARLDANKDGKITQAEADAAHKARAEAKAGAPSKTHAGFFARLDTNKDGVVTRAEFDTAAAQMKARMEQAGMRRGNFAEHIFSAADLNHDGRIAQAEVQQMALQHFDQADLNHDGKLTPDERKEFRQAKRAKVKS